jgi:SapC protein
MTKIELLNNNSHRTLRVQAGAAARYGDNQRFVAVIAGEFPHLAIHYPILLTKDQDTGAFFVGAMLGFDEGENLFLDESGMETYRPLNLQRGAFYTAGNEVAIDLDNPRIDDAGKPLFTDDGEPTQYLQSIMALFRDLKPGLEMTRVFVETLARLKLIEPIDIDLAFDDGTKRRLTELYTINQDVLRALPDANVIDLFRRGYLQLIYLMMASLKQVPVLARRKNDALLKATSLLGV